MFHEMTLKLYFMKCSKRNISQCILPFRQRICFHRVFVLICFPFKAFLKVSGYPFKQNENVFKNMTVLLKTYFYNISLNVPRPTFFNICNLSFLPSPIIGKIRVKVGPNTNYFFLLQELMHQKNLIFKTLLIIKKKKKKKKKMNDSLLGKTPTQFCAAVCQKCMRKVES